MNVLMCSAVPDKPSGVLVNSSTPNTVRLRVLPPGDYNGLDVLGYRVKYDEFAYDFDAGSSEMRRFQLLLCCTVEKMELQGVQLSIWH